MMPRQQCLHRSELQSQKENDNKENHEMGIAELEPRLKPGTGLSEGK
jgi:hypothetical protein